VEQTLTQQSPDPPVRILRPVERPVFRELAPEEVLQGVVRDGRGRIDSGGIG
jgi:hypothetical protein